MIALEIAPNADLLLPPKVLYKFLAPELVEPVLQNQTAKFTQLANTNDVFEVRPTFKRIGGPLFHSMLKDMLSDLSSKEELNLRLIRRAEEAVGQKLSRHMRRKLAAHGRQERLHDSFNKQLDSYVDIFEYHMGTEEVREQFLNSFGRDMLCYSLSERCDDPKMWGLYATNHGFVVGFDAHHDWFNSKKDRSKTRLHKVKYFDGFNDEVLDDPKGAFGSKTTDWEYEKEWRIYCGMDDIQKSIPSSPDPIHLIHFPADMVASIILGARSSQDTIDKIIALSKTKFPNADLLKAVPDPRTAKINIQPL